MRDLKEASFDKKNFVQIKDNVHCYLRVSPRGISKPYLNILSTIVENYPVGCSLEDSIGN